MVVIPLLFYLSLSATGSSLEEARDFGWVGPTTNPGSAASLVALFDFELVDWSLLPQQFPVFASMVVVVAFSSCLDVAAIEVRDWV
jgi:SulP family sulfate permease